MRTEIARSLFKQKDTRARKYFLDLDSSWRQFVDLCFASRRRTNHNKSKKYRLNEWVEKHKRMAESGRGDHHFTELRNRKVLFVTAWYTGKDIRIITDGFHRTCAIKYPKHSPETPEPFGVLKCYGTNMNQVSRERRLFVR
ncbi:MAG TPA: hypothetical protein VHA09_06925 [Nitrososphaera sp.]|nr:hypothetical protein [Nitrososphaera sp.]